MTPTERNRPLASWPPEPAAKCHGSRGIALVAVLWVLTLLAVIAGSFTTDTRTEARLARNAVENAKAGALADAGVYRAVLGLLQPRSGVKLGAEMESLLMRRPELGQVLTPEDEETPAEESGQRWRVDGTLYVWQFGGGEVVVSIHDEGGKIDLNAGADELLQGLFVSVGLDDAGAAALVDAIADFRDPNDLRRLNGAEEADYRAAGLDYGPKNRPFEAVEELQQVLGMTLELYEKAAPALTVHSGRPGINPATAPREALLALPGVDPGNVEALLAARAEGDDAAARERALGLAGLSAVGGLPSAPWGLRFTVRAEARTANGAVFVREAVARLSGDPDEIVVFYTWKQGALRASDEDDTSRLARD